MTDFKKGDKVQWSAHGNTVTGTVEEKLTKDTEVNGQTAKASPDDPRYAVKTEKGKEAAHKASALTKHS